MPERTEREEGYIDGRRAALERVIEQCLGDLGYNELLSRAALLAERGATLSALRELAAAIGDNDWPDAAYLPDVVKRLRRRVERT
jgi:hypothetical protein